MNDDNKTITGAEQYAQMLNIGATLQQGKYRIDRYLGCGGFGNTYLATNTILDLHVVIKEFFIRGVTSRKSDGKTVNVSVADNVAMWNKMVEKFKREARHMFKIDHPNIVRVHDCFEENNTAYYVMDVVNGKSLHDRVTASGTPLSEREVREKVLPQVFDALERIHSEHLWHLDVKPANLMQDADGRIKLIDFGASKQSESGEGVTTTGMAYTPRYAAPEQVLQQTRSIGAWTDLYALGATIYNLLTGLKPPTQVDIDDLGADAFNYSAAPVSEQMRYAIIQLMKTRRKERPQNVAEARRLFSAPQELHDEATVISGKTPTAAATPNARPTKKKAKHAPQPEATVAIPVKSAESGSKRRNIIVTVTVATVIAAAVALTMFFLRHMQEESTIVTPDDIQVESASTSTVVETDNTAATEADQPSITEEKQPEPADKPNSIKSTQQPAKAAKSTNVRQNQSATQKPASQNVQKPTQSVTDREIREKIRDRESRESTQPKPNQQINNSNSSGNQNKKKNNVMRGYE